MATKWKIERGESDIQCSHTHTPVGQEKMKVVQYAQSDTTTLFGSHGTHEGIKHEGKRWSTQEECRFLSKKTWMPQSTRTHWEEEDTSRAKKRTRRPVNDYCDAMYFKETKEKVCAPMLIASLVKLPLAEFAIRLRDSSRGGSFLAN